jgi:sialate O-acetylesterase
MKRLCVFFLFVALALTAQGKSLKVADIFSDNMVLQQQTQAPIWGWATPGSTVSVIPSWNNQSYSAVTNMQGKWKVSVATPKAGGPYTVSISGADNARQTLRNVYIGEVWLASGQSNMSMPLMGYYCQPVYGSTQAILNAGGKHIHFVNIPIMGAYQPQDGFIGQWKEATPQTVASCTAVGWFFADFLHKYLNVPIGIINASYGGSNVEAWMTPEACKKIIGIDVPALSDRTDSMVNNVPTVLFNGMISPVQGYAIKGTIWYQGESNIFNVPRYAPSVAAMIEDWRKRWAQGDFPFYYVQIAPYDYRNWNFFTPQWPEISAYLRESQLKDLSLIPNSGMAVLMDVGESQVIHPSHKKEVGDRLGLLSLSKTYGWKGFEAESPCYERMDIQGNKVVLHFSAQFGGLTNYDKPLELFEIAGENRVFQKAEAYIDENNGTIVVSCKLVDQPKAVRYAFKNDVKGELFGTGGLPVSSFRTDNWE